MIHEMFCHTCLCILTKALMLILIQNLFSVKKKQNRNTLLINLLVRLDMVNGQLIFLALLSNKPNSSTFMVMFQLNITLIPHSILVPFLNCTDFRQVHHFKFLYIHVHVCYEFIFSILCQIPIKTCIQTISINKTRSRNIYILLQYLSTIIT